MDGLSPVSIKADALREFWCTSARQFRGFGDSSALWAFDVLKFFVFSTDGEA